MEQTLSLSEQLVRELTAGRQPAEVSDDARFAWERLSLVDQDQLFVLADTDSSAQIPLVEFLQRATWKQRQDRWVKLRAAALYFRHIDMPASKKVEILNWMDGQLKELKVRLEDADVPRHISYQADVRRLKAELALSEGRLTEAINDFRVAATRYESCGQLDRARACAGWATQLSGIQGRGQTLLPAADQRQRQLELHEQLQVLETDRQNRASELESLQRQRESLQHELEGLTSQHAQQTEDFNTQQAKWQSQLQAEQEQLARTKQEVVSSRAELEPAAEFLARFPYLATAPLWVEVVKLALRQGDIDELTIAALDRLAEPFPDRVLPLLAEIMARLPDPSLMQLKTDSIARLQTAIMDAKSAPDGRARAEALAQAWETFLQLSDRA